MYVESLLQKTTQEKFIDGKTYHSMPFQGTCCGCYVNPFGTRMQVFIFVQYFDTDKNEHVSYCEVNINADRNPAYPYGCVK